VVPNSPARSQKGKKAAPNQKQMGKETHWGRSKLSSLPTDTKTPHPAIWHILTQNALIHKSTHHKKRMGLNRRNGGDFGGKEVKQVNCAQAGGLQPGRGNLK